MQIFDFHIHSKYSRACSKQLDLEHIELWSQIKGIDIVGTGDFTHPAWIKEIGEKLRPQGNGLFKLHSPEVSRAVRQEADIAPREARDMWFCLSTELSCIYSQGGAVRRIHLLVVFPELAHVHRLIAELEKRGGKLKSDGRPILGMTAKDIADICLTISDKVLLVPAHVWTPWFAIFGSKSGFDSVEECFEDYAQYIYALETGLSSDPKMNWQLSQNDKYVLMSNSDAHSLDNLGREANVFNLPEVSYDQILEAIKEKDRERFLYTIEFFPEEGKYHLDGHRDCHFACMPEETRKLKERCPKCGKKLTVGVHNRISSLADRGFGFEPEGKIPYRSIVPLAEILADVLGVSKKSKKVYSYYRELINNVGNEFHILLDADIALVEKHSTPMIAEGVKRVREGNVEVSGGYDGVYGRIKVFSDAEKGKNAQKSLF